MAGIFTSMSRYRMLFMRTLIPLSVCFETNGSAEVGRMVTSLHQLHMACCRWSPSFVSFSRFAKLNFGAWRQC